MTDRYTYKYSYEFKRVSIMLYHLQILIAYLKTNSKLVKQQLKNFYIRIFIFILPVEHANKVLYGL